MCSTCVPEIVWTDPYGWVWLDYNLLSIFYHAFEQIFSILESWFCTDVRSKEPEGLSNCYLLTNRIELLSEIIIVFNKSKEYLEQHV